VKKIFLALFLIIGLLTVISAQQAEVLWNGSYRMSDSSGRTTIRDAEGSLIASCRGSIDLLPNGTYRLREDDGRITIRDAKGSLITSTR
jgi:hypothetical protein